MPGSTVSLESLSSPSPSPPPPQEQHTVSASASTSNHSGGPALDSGSELSELTEEEQENDLRDDDSDDGRTSSRSRQKKRGIVPAPMWDWAYKQKKGDWKQKQFEEEEEEEQAGPARAMEEEEDDDRDDHSRHSYAPDTDDRRRPQRAPPRALSENENEDDEEGHESEDEPVQLEQDADDRDSGEDDEDEEDDDNDRDREREIEIGAGASRGLKGRTSPGLTEDEDDNIEEDYGDGDGDIEGDEDEAPDTSLEEPESTKEPIVTSGTPLEGAMEADVDHMDLDAEVDADVDADEDVEESVRPSAIVSPVPLATAGSSIMAGSTVVAPPSPSPSSSSASGSPSSSRSPSPEPAPSDHEPEPEPEPQRKPSSIRPRTRKTKARTRSRRSKALRGADADADADADVAQAAAPEAEEREGPDADDIDEPEMELESDLQPAHRAEALDVLATIELKFALLRERLYVEKMDTLAWEESLVAEGSHPELLHLHTELSTRRNKRLDLATRRRDYEIANVTKRRKLDEDTVWSTWQYARDDLQTEMISETNRKRRKLERERRMLERPQPVRRIPNPPHEIAVPPTLREIIKAYPFGAPASTHSSHQSHHSRSHVNPASLAYPQLSTLSRSEVNGDLELLIQHRRAAAVGYDMHRPVLMNTVLGGMPLGYEPFGTGMTMLDGPGTINRFAPPPSFQQQQQHVPPHAQMQGPPMMQGFSNLGPRLAHHPSTPNLHHVQMPMDQEMVPMQRPDSRTGPLGAHMQQFSVVGPMQAPGPGSLMRRSISPVPVQSLSNGAGLGIPMGTGAPYMAPGYIGELTDWHGMGLFGPGLDLIPAGMKDRRTNGDSDGRERERDRERYLDGSKARERAERELEREQDRGYPMQLLPQHHSAHQHVHQHIHSAPGQVAHNQLGPHHHHHHHHHVVHNHPVQSSVPGLGHQSPLPPPGSGLGQGMPLSPHHLREIEARRPHSGTPMEVVELSASNSKPSLWKGDEPPPPSLDLARDRGRPPLGPPHVGSHDRLMTPSMTAPGQVQANFPTSPRNGPGHPVASGSNVMSRRSSWSVQEENGLPRPSSSSSHGHGHMGSSHSQNNSVAGYSRPYPQRAQRPPSTQPPQNTLGSPPVSNGRPLPSSMSPPHPAFSGPIPSPTRLGPPVLPPPHLSPPMMAHSPPARLPSPPNLGSSGLKTVPSSPGQAKAPLRTSMSAPHPEQQFGGPTLNVVSIRPSEPITLFPPHGPPTARMANGGIAEKHTSPHLGGGPLAPKVVPVDGS
ncbi:Sds3-like-domain-containing protein [Amylocystis lapponica]|nr:Sds3-like-domain-containing protein [Amylocystis lapponica]